MLLEQCTTNLTQMGRVGSNVEIPMPLLSLKGQTAGARTMHRLPRSKQIFVMIHVQDIKVTGVDLVRQVCTPTLP